jgi:ADP-heptose:LPS heptosyltransferase
MKLWLEKGGWASTRARSIIAERRPEDIHSIAVIRHAALGDQVLTRPFLLQARRFFPNASLTLSLIESYQYGAPVDLVDRVHVAAGRGQVQLPLRVQIARARELGEHDLLFDFAATSRSYWLSALTRAWLKIGFPYRHRLGKMLYDVTFLRSDYQFEADLLLDALAIFGCKTERPLRFGFPQRPLRRERPYIIYFPGASTATKKWPPESFKELISTAATTHPKIEHIILRGLTALDAVGDIADPLRLLPNVTTLEPADLSDTVSLLKGASLVVSNDTGIRNLAIAAEVPTLGIFFSTIPYRYWPRWGEHDVVFNSDGSIPSVADVATAFERILGREGVER